MAIFDIGDATEIEGVLDLAYNYNGPVYIRMLRKEVPRLFPANEPMQFNRARVLSEGDDIVLLSSSICTEEAMRATAVLKEKGVSVQHMHVSTLKPFTDPTIVEAIKKSKYGVVTIENHLDIGGLGSAVADVIAENGLGKRLVKIGLPGYPHGASKMYLMKKYGIDAMHPVSADRQEARRCRVRSGSRSLCRLPGGINGLSRLCLGFGRHATLYPADHSPLL